MVLDRLTNLIIFLYTTIMFILGFRKDGIWSSKNGLFTLRFFTILSNLLCALAALAVCCTLGMRIIPWWVWMSKYIGTVAVTVTFLTVMVFLGPTLGYKSQLSGTGFYYHLSGPLLAILSFCFMERYYTLSFPLSLCGMIPVLLYGLVYLYKVVLCPEEKRWNDFYGYNKNGKWPLSFLAMIIGAFLICLLIRLLYSI